MATLREKKPGVWEVRVVTGMSVCGRPTQLSRTVHGTQRDAQRLAADMEVGPGRASSGGRLVSDALEATRPSNTSSCPTASAVGGAPPAPPPASTPPGACNIYATGQLAIGRGHAVRTVARRLGHTNPAMTLRDYVHAFAASDQALASLGNILRDDR